MWAPASKDCIKCKNMDKLIQKYKQRGATPQKGDLGNDLLNLMWGHSVPCADQPNVFFECFQNLCRNCQLCVNGRKKIESFDNKYDPHIIGDSKNGLLFIVGGAPGITELQEQSPIQSAIIKNLSDVAGVDMSQFYATNIIKCFCDSLHNDECDNYFKMEIQYFKPKFVVSLGSLAHKVLCGGNPKMGTITKENRFGIPVYPIEYPSVYNLNKYENLGYDIKKLGALIRRIT